MTLRNRILLITIPVSILAIASIYIIIRFSAYKTISEIENVNSRNILGIAMLTIKNQYTSLQFHKEYSFGLRKTERKNIVAIAKSLIQQYYNDYKAGKLSEEKAKKMALERIENFRYDNGKGYIWINNTREPIPRMIMHPIFPELNNKLLSDSSYYSTPESKNLFSEAVALCKSKGSGFIKYKWPIPTDITHKVKEPKISYVELFEPWQWVIGTGVYLVDIESDAKNRLDAIIDELKQTIGQIRIAETGYFYIFTSKKEFVLHPAISETGNDSILDFINKNAPIDEIMKAAKLPGKNHKYLWLNPVNREDKLFYKKEVFVEYFEPLDWYVCASIYRNEVEKPGKFLGKRILYVSVFFLLVSIIVSIGFSRSITRPLTQLMKFVSKLSVRDQQFSLSQIPIAGTLETKALSKVLKDSLIALEEHKNNLEKLVAKRTAELKKANKELKDKNQELVEKNRTVIQQKEEMEATFNLLRDTQARLIQSEKMASLGILTGGVAHEINNPLNYVSGGYAGLQDYFKTSEEGQNELIQFFLKSINTGIERISRIVKGLNQFSIDKENYDEDCEINIIIENCLLVMQNQFENRIEINTQFEENELVVKGNIGKLHQVIINIIQNAIHAIKDKGTIVITTKIENEVAIIKISDTGTGIPEKDLTKITDPFYTTKEPGKGTGLGLSISYSIIEEHSGTIEFESELGKGTTVLIKLPVKK